MAHNGLPGIGSARTADPRDIFYTHAGKTLMPSNRVIGSGLARDPGNTGNVDILRAGLLLTKDENGDGHYVATILGVLTAENTGGSTGLTVDSAVATEISRRYGATGTGDFAIVGYGSGALSDEGMIVLCEAVTHSAINTETGVITVSNLSNDYPVGSLLIAGEALRSASNCQLFSTVILCDSWGVKVTDDDSNNIAVPLTTFPVAGVIDVTKIVNYPSADSLAYWLKNELKDNCPGLTFSDDF